jgi:hypothetical protein
MQVLQRQWNPTFSDSGHGFRPGRQTHQAVAHAQQYIAAGSGWVVDLDSGEILQSSQSRQIDASDSEASSGQAAAEAHPCILECRSGGERAGQSQRGGDSAGSPLSP